MQKVWGGRGTWLVLLFWLYVWFLWSNASLDHVMKCYDLGPWIHLEESKFCQISLVLCIETWKGFDPCLGLTECKAKSSAWSDLWLTRLRVGTSANPCLGMKRARAWWRCVCKTKTNLSWTASEGLIYGSNLWKWDTELCMNWLIHG